MGTIQQRLKNYIEFKGETIRTVEKDIGVSQDSLGKAIRNNKSFGVETLEKISKRFPKLNLIWLIHGLGEMEVDPNKEVTPPSDIITENEFLKKENELLKGLADLYKSQKK